MVRSPLCERCFIKKQPNQPNRKKTKKKTIKTMLQISKFKDIAYLENVCSCQINKIVIIYGGSSGK